MYTTELDGLISEFNYHTVKAKALKRKIEALYAEEAQIFEPQPCIVVTDHAMIINELMAELDLCEGRMLNSTLMGRLGLTGNPNKLRGDDRALIRKIAEALKSIGWVRNPLTVKFAGKVRRVWHCPGTGNAWVTLKNGELTN